MIEGVENHMPQVIIIDEIGTELEVLAARTIAEKGVQLIGTTHGNCLENLIKNPSLVDLIGGIHHVTLSDDEAKRRGTKKSILERKAYPSFEVLIEIKSQTSWTIHEDIKTAVDFSLLGNVSSDQTRQFSFSEKIQIYSNLLKNDLSSFEKQKINFSSSFLGFGKNWVVLNQPRDQKLINLKFTKLIIYPYSISHNLLNELLLQMGFQFILTNEIRKANLIIGLKKHLKKNFKLIKLAQQNNISIYTLNQVSVYQLRRLFQFLSS